MPKSADSDTPNPESSDTQLTDYPTPFQRRVIWTGLAAVFVVIILGIAVGFVLLTSNVLGYLQPVLVPVAVAGILAYLLEPLILWLWRNGMRRKRAVLLVFAAFNILMILLAVLVLQPTIHQGKRLFDPVTLVGVKDRAAVMLDERKDQLDSRFGEIAFYENAKAWLKSEDATDWMTAEAAKVSNEVTALFGRGLSGAVKTLGYLLGFILVPVYLYYFLLHSSTISQRWSDYLPLWESRFKDELVGTLSEINGYLIAYFRGQMLVSIIDGVLIAIALKLIGLPYALLLGVLLAILGLIPFIGSLLVMIPASLIAFFHFSAREPIPAADVSKYHPDRVVEIGSGEAVSYELYIHTWNWLPDQIWAYVLIVIGIFVVLQQINSLFTAPKIVGDSVGLHPITVIFSMVFWSLIMGGILGALLAVPLTAAVKVLLKRYIWESRVVPGVKRHFVTGTPEEDPPEDAAPAKG